jgi:hypothetical protein
LSTAEEVALHKQAADLSKQIPRRWKAGDIYAPHDLRPEEMDKWKKRGRPEVDVVDVLALDPISEYKVCWIYLPPKMLQKAYQAGRHANLVRHRISQ